MVKKKDPSGGFFPSVMENLKKTNGTILKPFKRSVNKKNVAKKIQAPNYDKNIKGGIIQKVLPIVNADEAFKVFQLDKAGQILRQKREGRGLSVTDVANTLCFRKSSIEAIESGNWDGLPHKVYVNGYVRKYASLLGVDEEIALCMTDKCQEAVQERVQERVQEAAVNLPRDDNNTREPKQKAYAPFIFGVIVIAISGFFVYDMIHKDQVATPKSEKSENAEYVANNVNSGDEEKDIPQITDTKKLIITCHDRTWITVIIDGAEKKELMLKPEEVVTLNAKEKFDLLVGNAGGVSIIFNGKDIGFTGKKGEVKKVSLS